ncbi:MAG: LytTR family transcriptional regulator DNA-binding domain-containing protein [Cyclobacteriaceae bacterium]|nr:LytTR family transcriptional regulator DNA-binding domain-containing protein [Cyclobacteriaceae bacterium]
MQVVLANENPLIIDQLQKLLEIHQVETVHSAFDYIQLSKYLRENEYDFAIIGAKMQNTSTLELLKNHQNSMQVIITSPGIDDAYAAIKAHAVDYLLEPLQHEEASESIMGILSKSARKKTDKSSGVIAPKKRFLVKVGDKMKSVSVSEVAYIFADGKLIYMVTASTGRKYIIDYTMDELDHNLLDTDYFFRINRKYFIHIQAIEEVRPYVNSRLKILLNVPGDQDMIVSRDKVVAFKRWLNL